MNSKQTDWQAFLEAWPFDWDVSARTLVSAYMGSTSHGTYVPPTDPLGIDDIDVMPIVQPPRRYVYGLESFEHWTPVAGTYGDLDVICYSVTKFAKLLLKGNPNVLGMLWLAPEHIMIQHPMWAEWQENRAAFVSEHVYTSFVGYSIDQLRRLSHPNHLGRLGRDRKAQFERFGYSPKNAAHCLRLLRMGLELIETGELHVDRSGIDAEELIAVKLGEWPLSRVEREAEKGLARMDAARAHRPLPPEPDVNTVEGLLMATIEALW